MKNHYPNIQGSLMRHCALLAQKLSALSMGQFVPMNLDAFTDEDAWPKEHFIALGEFRLSMDDVYEGSAIIGIGLKEDTNLLRSAELVGKILDEMLPNHHITVVDLTTGDPIGLLLIKGGVTVAPPLRTKTRPIIPILFAFTSNLQTS